MKRDEELTVEGLAHDLNNVFETISEAAELLTADPKWTKIAGTIRRSVNRGRRIVDSLEETMADTCLLSDVLDISTLHADDVLTFTQGAAITWTRKIDPAVVLPGPPAAWERVFVNLFLNAARANPQGAEVTIAASLQSGAAVITVCDNGNGIPASILPRIFEPHVTTKKTRGRSGLGLHIVHTIVTGHGGKVTAVNREPLGATFTIWLPAAGVE